MTISKSQIAAATLSTLHIKKRERFAAFHKEEASRFAPNPFAATSFGVVVQAWATRRIEFTAFGVIEAGLTSLLSCARALCQMDPLVQEILKAGSHTLYLFHDGDSCRILGGVLHGKPGVVLPAFMPVASLGADHRPLGERSSTCSPQRRCSSVLWLWLTVV